MPEIEVLEQGQTFGRARTMVWELELSETRDKESLDGKAITAFLAAHGLTHTPVPSRVEVEADRGLWLYAQRLVFDADGQVALCPHCPCCAKQELVRVPLSAPCPDVAGAQVNWMANGPDLREWVEAFRRDVAEVVADLRG